MLSIMLTLLVTCLPCFDSCQYGVVQAKTTSNNEEYVRAANSHITNRIGDGKTYMLII
jgi:hypothetical protein